MGEAFVTQVDGCRHEAVAIRGDPPAARARHLGNEPIGVKAREQTAGSPCLPTRFSRLGDAKALQLFSELSVGETGAINVH